jgi:hypothetical protein
VTPVANQFFNFINSPVDKFCGEEKIPMNGLVMVPTA